MSNGERRRPTLEHPQIDPTLSITEQMEDAARLTDEALRALAEAKQHEASPSKKGGKPK